MKKISNAIMLILLISAVFIYYTEMVPVKIDAVKLASEFSKNKIEAEKKYLNKDLQITGIVKAFYKLLDVRNTLELNTEDDEINIFCFFLKETDEYKASKLSNGDTVVVTGTLIGKSKYTFIDGLKIEVKNIKKLKEY
jgi:tRNA(Ile2) C34 agmatinyltransferase TiaS